MKKYTKKQLEELYPTTEGWYHATCERVSPLSGKEVEQLASLLLSGSNFKKVDVPYTHQEGNSLIIVCRLA
jgi:hypothetical protein